MMVEPSSFVLDGLIGTGSCPLQVLELLNFIDFPRGLGG